MSCGVMTSAGVASCRATLGAVGASVVRSEQATMPKTDDASNARLLHGRPFMGLSLVILALAADGPASRIDLEAALEGHAQKPAVFRHQVGRHRRSRLSGGRRFRSCELSCGCGLELAKQKEARLEPFPLDRPRRDLKELRHFLLGEAAEESQLYDPAEP